ncbi:protoporphyrinogen oxidase [Limosilactobacillus antri DSM 16041]|uniref:Coproporphyrinogen III oxidase n=3 Tax=Limosilactobacillus antri TaxID=227943 RepID=C8P9W4_9LACO|nr:protoporphyrinogen oxidase [Limosilactobacillus antri DSM 16041]
MRRDRIMKKVVIVGGGLSGLSAAYYLGKAKPMWDIQLYESADRFGGKVQTKHIQRYTVEMGPDSYLARKPAMTKLVTELGLSKDVVINKTDQAYIYSRRKLYPIPGGSIVGIPTKLIPFAETRLLSTAAKFRVLSDYFKRPYSNQGDVSIGDFFKYHLGEEMVAQLIEPLMAGIYGGDIYKLSLDSAFPQFHQMERRSGNLIRGVLDLKNVAYRNVREYSVS